MRIPPNFDVPAMRQALTTLLEHHDALRLRIERVSGEWTQRIVAPGEEIPFEEVDLTREVNEQLSARIEEHAARQQLTLSLANGPIFKVVWMNTGNRTGRLLVIAHHIAVDAISWPILLEDLMSGYRRAKIEGTVHLPRKTNSFKDWSIALQNYAKSAELLEQRTYWLEAHRKLVKPIPLDTSGGTNDRASVDYVLAELDTSSTRELTDLVSVAHLAPLNIILIAALVRAVTDWTKNEYCLVNVEGHGREGIDAELNVSRTVGWFTSYYPLLVRMDDISTLDSLVPKVLRRIDEVPARGIGYLVLRYLGEQGLREQLNTFPKAEIGFNFMGHHRESADTRDSADAGANTRAESIGATVSQRGIRQHKLDVTGVVRQGKLQMRWTYSRNLHNRQTIEMLAKRYFAVIREIVASVNAMN